jgi:hypothetical protein
MLTYNMPAYGQGMMTVANEAKLNVVSFGLGQLFAWGMGCGVHRFELTVSKNRVGVAIFMDPLNEPPGGIQAANCSTMKSMNDWGLIPTDIPQIERMNVDGAQQVMRDGQNRFSMKEGQGMMIQTYNVRPDLTVAAWAFAYSDHCTGFLWRGVKKIKIFHSMKLTQIHMTPELDRDLVRHMMSDAEDYPQDTLVSSIKS